MGRLIWGLRLIGIGMLAPIVAIFCSLPFIASDEWRFLLEPTRRGVVILDFLALGGGGLACASGPLTIPTRILLGMPPFLLLLGFAITQPCLVAAAVLFFTLGLNGVSRELLPEKLPMKRLTIQIGLGLLCTFSGRDWAALGTVLLIGSGLMQLSAAYSTVLRQLLERVARGLSAPSSHTTVRMDPYTAVHKERASLLRELPRRTLETLELF